MSQSNLSLTASAPPQSRLTKTGETAGPWPDLILPLTGAQVWGSLNAQQQARVSQALITLCCQIAAVAPTAGSGSGNQEGGDEQS